MPDPRFIEARVSFSSCTAEVASKLGIGGVVSASGSASRRVLLINVLMLDATEHVQERDTETGRPTLYRHGAFGARLAVEVSRVDIESDVSLSFLAARSDFSTNKAGLDAEGFGLPNALEAELVGMSGDLSADALGAIRAFFTRSLPGYLRAEVVATNQLPAHGERHPLQVHPVLTSAPAREKYSPLHSINFAIRHIATHTPLERALELVRETDVIEDAVAESIVRDVYKKYGITTGTPTPTAAQRARTWLQEARGK